MSSVLRERLGSRIHQKNQLLWFQLSEVPVLAEFRLTPGTGLLSYLRPRRSHLDLPSPSSSDQPVPLPLCHPRSLSHFAPVTD